MELKDSYAMQEQVLVEEYYAQGARDAGNGIYNLPYEINDCNPLWEDEIANDAYKTGFTDKRIELGDAFQWA